MSQFGSVSTAMVTPFAPDGSLDLDGAAALAGWLVENGSDSLVLAGTTGEGPTLTDSERIELFRRVRRTVDVPLIAGTGTNDTAHSILLTKEAQEIGMDGILAVTPYYNRPPQSGLYDHFAAIAAATTLPVALYDVPKRTGRKIASETIIALAVDIDNITVLKDAAGDVAETAWVATQVPPGFEIYSGDDALTLPLLAVGAVGIVSVASHWVGRQLGEMIAAYESGDVARARTINAELTESYRFEGSDEVPNPLPTKALLRTLGLPSGYARLPLGHGPADLEDQARKLLSNIT